LQKNIHIAALGNILQNPIEYLKGVGPLRGDMLKKELGIFTFNDLLHHFPFRYLDKTKIDKIGSLSYQNEYAQIAGKLVQFETIGERRTKRLVAYLQDDTGEMELVWFQGMNWVEKNLQIGARYIVFGKLGFFMGKPQMSHPELEPLNPENVTGKKSLDPIYPSTEKLKARGLTGRAIGKLTQVLMSMLTEKDLPENLPESIVHSFRFISRFQSYQNIHFPATDVLSEQAIRRLKFEELFFAQLRLALIRSSRHRFSRGSVFDKVGDLFNTFYKKFLPFELTNAQKRVLKEIRKDTGSSRQMNRLLQGDVGSGKTMVALLSMLIAADNGFQSAMMAPTEVLAKQHYATVSALLNEMPVEIRLLTGSTPAKEKRKIIQECEEGIVHILIGTHALIEDKVKFSNLGFAVVDEQHKFGVAQRALLWGKNKIPPHILVMTATPIPRTLALTAYGDLDYSIMDELPPGRKPITTVHRYEQARPQVMDFIKGIIEKGNQVYVVYPLIDESAKVDYENLMKGYEEVKSFFPEPKYWISMVHGKQSSEQKETNMNRFKTKDTQILVGTTVIEVGVDVPNATVMIIESAERFGLSQLHQLRGRVGRGKDDSFCILLTSNRITKEAKERLNVFCSTNDGFKIAEKDLEIRGPGEIDGTRQSGVLNFKLASIIHDRAILEAARTCASDIMEKDPELNLNENQPLKNFLHSQKNNTEWSKIS
jgi:ATP-dependent DNA helicase RecG